MPPVMAFHLGSLGFLTPFRFDNFQKQVTKVLEGDAALTLRSRLRCIIVRKNQDKQQLKLPCDKKDATAQRAISNESNDLNVSNASNASNASYNSNDSNEANEPKNGAAKSKQGTNILVIIQMASIITTLSEKFRMNNRVDMLMLCGVFP